MAGRIRKSALALIGVVLAIVGAFSSTAWAQGNYPTKAVNLIVPFPPGGAVDQAGRSIAQALSALWKQPVVINTRPGAGGGVGAAAAAHAAPDGYTLLATHPSIISVPEADRLFGRTPQFERSNFAPLALLVADPVVLVVKADLPWKTYEEFVADARKNPDTITYSSSGAYSAIHLPVEMLAHAAGLKLRNVSYSGGGPALTAVLGGHVAATAGAPAVLAPQIKGGTLRALVTTGAKRHPLLPDVPTAMELGYKDVEFYLWVGLFAQAKMPETLQQQIRRDVGRAVQDPDFVSNMAKIGAPVDYRDGAAFAAFLDGDAARISAAMKRIGKVE